MALSPLNWRLLPPVTLKVGYTIFDYIDAVYQMGISTEYADGSARTPGTALVATADRLNPARPDGGRAATFLCIELVEPSADNSLRTLGERHGGATGYLLLDRESLGLTRARVQPASTRNP